MPSRRLGGPLSKSGFSTGYPGPRAALEDLALLHVPVEYRVHGVLDGEDEARRGLLGHTLDADVEPYRRVESGPLVDNEPLELGLEAVRLGPVHEVAVLFPPRSHCAGDPVHDLLQRPLALGGAERAAKVLLSEDVGRVDAPRGRHLDSELLEGNRASDPVGDPGVASFPGHGLVGVRPRDSEVAAYTYPCPLRGDCHVSPPCPPGLASDPASRSLSRLRA
jgi:hypothetical protein